MLSTVLLVVALIFFIMAALPSLSNKLPFSLVPAGLACWVLSILIGSGMIN